MAEKVDPRVAIAGIVGSNLAALVSGTANLPDGTRLRCGLWQGKWDGPFDRVIYRDTSLLGGRFVCRFELPSEWSGTVSASVELIADGDQPAHVQALDGRRGEYLAYSDAKGSDFAVVVAVGSTVIP